MNAITRILKAVRPKTAMDWLIAAILAATLLAVLAGCSSQPTRAQIFVTGNGDKTEIWCEGYTLHSRPLDRSEYGTDTPGEITNPNDPYCTQGATGNYIVNDSWFLGWYGYYYYTPSWHRFHPYPSITVNTYSNTTVHTYTPPPGTKVKPGTINGGIKPADATKVAEKVKTTGTLPPPDPKTRITGKAAPDTPVKATTPKGTLPAPKATSAPKTPSNTFAPPKAGTQIPAAQAPKAPAPKPAAPKPAAPKPAAPRPAAPRPAAPRSPSRPGH